MRGKRAWGIIVLAILLGATVIVFRLGKTPPDTRSASVPSPPTTVSTSALPPAAPTSSPAPIDPRRATALTPNAAGLVVWPGAAEASKLLNQPDQSVREDIEVVHTMLADYHKVFGQVPEGGLNEEIIRGLRGDNPKKIIFLTAKPGTLNSDGELLDRWGSPYFFHKLSHDIIDLRSAGPDRKLWTPDDIFEQSASGPPL